MSKTVPATRLPAVTRLPAGKFIACSGGIVQRIGSPRSRQHRSAQRFQPPPPLVPCRRAEHAQTAFFIQFRPREDLNPVDDPVYLAFDWGRQRPEKSVCLIAHQEGLAIRTELY